MVDTEFLKNVELFKSLSDEEIEEVSQSISSEHYSQGSVIIEEGTPGDSLYILQSGTVIIERERDGAKIQLAAMEPPSFFGEMSLIDESYLE